MPLLLLPLLAGAQTEAIRIDYKAHAGCPEEGAFVAELKARTSKARLAGAAEKARTFKVRITQGGPGSVGRIEAVDLQGAVTVREVSGAKCAEVVSALALTAWLAIDPDSLSSPPPPASSSVPPIASGAPPPPPTANASASTPAPPPPPKPDREPARRTVLELALHGEAAFGIAPQTASGASLGAELRSEGNGAYTPTLRMSLGHVRNDLGRDPDAAFAATWLGVDACPWLFGASSGFSAAPCARLTLGLLRGEGRPISDPATATAAWVPVGALARGRLRLTGGLGVELDGGVAFPLSRPVFSLDRPKTELHSTPAVVGVVSGGMSYLF